MLARRALKTGDQTTKSSKPAPMMQCFKLQMKNKSNTNLVELGKALETGNEAARKFQLLRQTHSGTLSQVVPGD